MGEIRQASIDLLAVDGAEFKLLCPNSETVARIVAAFLDGLRRRSRWAVALDQSLTQTRGHSNVDFFIQSLNARSSEAVSYTHLTLPTKRIV